VPTIRTGPAVPILISADLSRTFAFYEELGFLCDRSNPFYGIMRAGDVELHVTQLEEFDPIDDNTCAAFIPTDDVDAIFTGLEDAGVRVMDEREVEGPDALRERVADGATVARMSQVEDKPWGIREFALFDPDNNLLRYGTFLAQE
jgi:catechol 2,3-dioxygenase-like lactoylglutathione lyase family enzyme